MTTIILNHKTHGECYADEGDFHSADSMIRVKLKTAVSLPHQDALLNYLTVGKGAIKEESRGYVPRHRTRSLVELYLPLAMSTAARMRSGYDDYDELTSIASFALMEAAEKFNERSGVYFPVFAKRVIENRIKDHWRKEIRKMEDTGDIDFDDLQRVSFKTDTDFMVEVGVAAQQLRPRLRQLIQRMYLSKQPALAKELAYEWNISEARITQLKQEAIGLLSVLIKKS